jgi:hypothetical protein
MAMLARFEAPTDKVDRRSSNRRILRLHATGRAGSDDGVVVHIHDLSLTGLLIETAADMSVGDRLEVELPEGGSSLARVVWNSGQHFGCEFISPISRATISAALLKNPVGVDVLEPFEIRSEEYPEELLEGPTDKLPLRTRFWIIVGLALASWAILLSIVALAFGATRILL